MEQGKAKSVEQKLREELAIYINSPYCNAYEGILKQINQCNKDMMERPAGLRDEEDAKAFERYEKYILKVDEYYEKLEYLRGKMKPEEVKKIDEKALKSKTVAV